jgi:hypothetical protein
VLRLTVLADKRPVQACVLFTVDAGQNPREFAA